MQIVPGSTSYFSAAADALDPRLFDGNRLRPGVRTALLGMLMAHLVHHFERPDSWTHAWIAGSGVSYQWEAARSPGDLDVLVGIDYVAFRASNPQYAGMSDAEISKEVNETFYASLTPFTRDWHGFEVTFYSNPWATDITAINPYAAYDLTLDGWTIAPDPRQHAPVVRSWQAMADRDAAEARQLVARYSQAVAEVRAARNPAHRVNAERTLHLAMEQAVGLFDEIHEGRKAAFSPYGQGYEDWGNYRWQAGKQSGIVPVLRAIKDYRDQAMAESQAQTYGMELPDADVLVRRAIRGGQ